MDDVLECGYSSRGCLEQFLHPVKRRRHESFCEFRPYPCPLFDILSCDWQGEPSEISSHVQTEHRSVSSLTPFPIYDNQAFFLRTAISGSAAKDPRGTSPTIVFLAPLLKKEKVPGENDTNPPTLVTPLAHFDETFYLCLSPPPLPSFIRVVGTRKRARSLVYKLELRKRRRRVIWEAKPVSIFDRITGLGNEIDEGKQFVKGEKTADYETHVDDPGDNLIWLDPRTLASLEDENGMVNVKVGLEFESNLQRSGWSNYEKCAKCAGENTIDTDYVFLGTSHIAGEW